MKTNHAAPLGATLPSGENFHGYMSKAVEMSFLDVSVELNRLFTFLLPEDAEEEEEMKAAAFQVFISKSEKRVFFSAQNNDLIISELLQQRKEAWHEYQWRNSY